MRFPLLPLLLFISIHVSAQNGWDLIAQNNFVAAKPAFEQAIKQNSKDESALIGLLFLSETTQDANLYESLVNDLMTLDWQSHYAWLFSTFFKQNHEVFLAKPMPETLRLSFLNLRADSLWQKRDIKGSINSAKAYIPDWKWAITGPFYNESGSGFMTPTVVEEKTFGINESFTNAYNVNFGWVKLDPRHPFQLIDFNSLPRSRKLATYYANTFLNLEKDLKANLHITRSMPMKIWVDDQLIFQSNRTAAITEWDGETLPLALTKGTHRILVKLSEFPLEKNDARISVIFNDIYRTSNVEEGEYEPINYDYNANEPTQFLLRLADVESGKTIQDIGTEWAGVYAPGKLTTPIKVAKNPFLEYFKQQVKSAPQDLGKQYLLSKAFVKSKDSEDGEAHFSSLQEGGQAAAFTKFLLAKFYTLNNKSDRTEALLSEMDVATCPTLLEHYFRLVKINKEQEESAYLEHLKKMLLVSPENIDLLDKYLGFLKEKGRNEEVKQYVKIFLETHKKAFWKDQMEEYIEDDSYKPESYQPDSDKEREKEYKKARKKLKKEFDINSYHVIIEYFKFKKRPKDVLATYDEIIAAAPWGWSYKFAKTRYLFEQERLDEALVHCESYLKDQPYDQDAYEMMGDIFVEKKDMPEALKWYRKADRIYGYSEQYGGLSEKIEKIENKKRYNHLFPTYNLGEMAKSRAWETKYADEEAVVSDFIVQSTYLPDENKILTTRKAIIHILSVAGAKNWTEANLQQIGQVSSVKVLKKDGSVTSPDQSYGTAVFKNLQPGDIILAEGTTEIEMPDELPGQFLNMHIPNWQAPIANAIYESLTPKDLALYYSCNRLECEPTTYDTGGFKMNRWEWNNVPKVESEEATPQNYDAYSWIIEGNSNNWENVVKWYQQKTYCRTEPNYEVLSKARELIKPGMSQAEIVETLHTFIVKDVNYSFTPFLNTNYVPKKPGATLAGKVGDCKDVATLMISLLQEFGISAWFTLVSTHNFSNKEPLPMIYIFNHAIVAYQLDDKVTRFADLTTDYYPSGVLPNGDCGAWGLIIRDGETKLQRLPEQNINPTISNIEIKNKAVLDADGNIHLEIDMHRKGVSAGTWREQMMRATPEERVKLLTEHYGAGVMRNLDWEQIRFLNLEDINEPLHIQLVINAFRQMNKVADFYIMPLPMLQCTPTLRSLFASKRQNDVDLDDLFEIVPSKEDIYFEIPDGFNFVEIPKNKEINSAFGTYSLVFERTKSGIHITKSLQFKQRFVSHNDYPALKEFYAALLSADDTLLAMKKR